MIEQERVKPYLNTMRAAIVENVSFSALYFLFAQRFFLSYNQTNEFSLSLKHPAPLPVTLDSPLEVIEARLRRTDSRLVPHEEKEKPHYKCYSGILPGDLFCFVSFGSDFKFHQI
jgi:hypothetical protein